MRPSSLEKTLILGHLTQVKKEPAVAFWCACLQSRCPRPWPSFSLGFHCSVLGTACQRATVETLWPVSSFSFKVWLETNWPNRQTESKTLVFANFLLKCYSNIKEKCVIPQSFCLLTYLWLRLLVNQVFSMAEVIGWHWSPQRDTVTRIIK